MSNSKSKVVGLVYGLVVWVATFITFKVVVGVHPVISILVSTFYGTLGGVVIESEFAKRGWKSLGLGAAYLIALAGLSYGTTKISPKTISAAIGIMGVIVAVISGRFFPGIDAFQPDRLIDWPREPRTKEEEYKSENTGCSLLAVGVILAILGALGWVIF